MTVTACGGLIGAVFVVLFSVWLSRRRVEGLSAGEAPSGFTIDQDLELRAAGEDIGAGELVLAAGTALGSNPLPIVVPCHRVLRSGVLHCGEEPPLVIRTGAIEDIGQRKSREATGRLAFEKRRCVAVDELEMKGLVDHGLPVCRFRRSTLPPREVRLRAVSTVRSG